MSEQGEPWWREQYDAHVAAYRIDDPVLDVALDRLCSGWSGARSFDSHPWNWAVEALSQDLQRRGGWRSVRDRLLSQNCSPDVVAEFRAQVEADADGAPLADNDLGPTSVADVSLTVATTRQLVVEYVMAHRDGDHSDEAAWRLHAAASVAWGGESAEPARLALAGELPLEEWWAEYGRASWRTNAYDWAGDVCMELSTAFDEKRTPGAPAVLEVWSRALDALPANARAASWVGCLLEDLYKLSSGAWWNWGRELVEHRAVIIDARVGEGWNAWRALSACWLGTQEGPEIERAWEASLERRAHIARTDDPDLPMTRRRLWRTVATLASQLQRRNESSDWVFTMWDLGWAADGRSLDIVDLDDEERSSILGLLDLGASALGADRIDMPEERALAELERIVVRLREHVRARRR